MNQNPQKLSLEMSIIQSHCVISFESEKKNFFLLQLVLQLRWWIKNGFSCSAHYIDAFCQDFCFQSIRLLNSIKLIFVTGIQTR